MLSHLTTVPVFFTLGEPKPLVQCVLNTPAHSCIASMRVPFLLPGALFDPSGVQLSLTLTSWLGGGLNSHGPSVFLSLAPNTDTST